MSADIEEFGNQMSYFYIAPSKKAFQKLQEDADKLQSELKSAGNGADILVSVMIARISEKYNWPISSEIFGNKAREIIDGKSALSKYISDDALIYPGKLDIWWASFFATGEDMYLDKLFEYVGKDVQKEKNTEYLLVYGSANWSFKANCRQHEKIRNFAEEKLNKGSFSDCKMKFVRECIDYAKQ